MGFNKVRFLVIFFIFLSYVLEAQWSVLPFNTGYKNHAVSFINKDIGYVSSGIFQGPPPGTNETYLYKTINGGLTWQTIVDDPTHTPISQLSFFTENFGIYRRWQDNLMKTVDGGFTGSSIITTTGMSNLNRFHALDSLQYIYSSANNINYTSNGGVTWTTKNLDSVQLFTNGYCFTQFLNLGSGFVWGCTFNPFDFYMYKTTDSCQSFQLSYYSAQLNGGLAPAYSRMKFLDSTTALFTLNNLVLKTSDFGTTWDTIYTGSSTTQWYSMDVKENIVVIGGNHGEILTSLDYGMTYQSDQSAGINAIITDICIADAIKSIVYATADNGLILKYEPITTDIASSDSPEIIVYPNPAQNILYINNYGKQKENIIIDVFGSTGAFVKTYNLNSTNARVESIDVSDWTPGCYFIGIKNSATIHYQKIIKQ